MSLCWLCSFPHRDVPVGAKNIPHRLRFTRALLESKDLSMRFSLPLCVWVSGIGPCSVETASEKRSPRTSYPPGWEAEFAGGGISKLPSARRDSQPACVWKPIFARNGLVSPDRDLQMCSEDRNSRGRVEVPDCPLPALQRHSQILTLFSMKEQASGICQT